MGSMIKGSEKPSPSFPQTLNGPLPHTWVEMTLRFILILREVTCWLHGTGTTRQGHMF
jgi:hypothetical protein